MQKQTYKILSFLLLTLLFSVLFPFNASAETLNFTWKSQTQINFKPSGGGTDMFRNADVLSVTTKALPIATAPNAGYAIDTTPYDSTRFILFKGSSDYKYFLATTSRGYLSGYQETVVPESCYLAVNKADTTKGIFYYYTTVNSGGSTGIQRHSEDVSVGGTPQIVNSTAITKGFIPGKIYLNGDLKANKPEDIAKNLKVGIYSADGGKILFRDGTLTNIPNGSGDINLKAASDGGFYYGAFDLSKANYQDAYGGSIGNGLMPGNYTLKIEKYSEGVSCGTGNLSGSSEGLGANLSQLLCSVEVIGEVNFSLAGNSDGSGTVKLLTPDGTHEKLSPIEGKSTATITDKDADKGLFLDVDVSFSSPLDQSLSSAIKAMAGFVESTLKFVMHWNYQLLTSTPKFVLSAGVEGAWTKIRNIALSLLVLALLIIAFANVLQIDIETYGLNRMIPRIILAIIFTSLSWLIVEFFFDFTAALQAQAVGLVGGQFGLDVFGSSFKIGMPVTGEILGKMGVVLLFLVLFFVVLICGIILLFSLLIRVVVLAFLLAVAPLAFIFSIMPFTETLYKRWWGEFWKWMFMGPVAVAIIALGYVVASGFGFGASSQTISYSAVSDPAAPSTNIMMGLLIFGASLAMAATLPVQWGGQIMKSWRGVGKWGRDNLLGGKYVKQGWQDFNKARGDKGMLNYNKLRSGIANSGVLGRAVAGTNKAQAAALKEGIDKSYEGMLGKLGANDLQKAAQGGGRKGMAAAKVMQDKYGDATKAFALEGELNSDGTWATDDPMQRKDWEDAAKARATGGEVKAYASAGGKAIGRQAGTGSSAPLAQMMASDRDFSNYMVDKNQEAALSVATATKNAQLSGQIASSNAGKSWSQKSPKFIKAVTKDFDRIQRDFGTTHNSVASAVDPTTGKKLSPEERTSALIAMGLSPYDAGQLVTFSDMQDSWARTADKGKIKDNAGDKGAAAITDFEGRPII